MDVESRDSVSLKPAELDELGQLASDVGLPLQDEQLDRHVEQFPLIALAAAFVPDASRAHHEAEGPPHRRPVAPGTARG